jgi:dihydroorotate dehydrogenase
MPDWTYRTLIRPVLFRLPAATARQWSLAALARLARMPAGPCVVEFFGHMQADPRLAVRVAGAAFPTAIGIGADLDPCGVAVGALSRFGVGFIEVGPVGETDGTVESGLAIAGESLRQTESVACVSAEELIPRLRPIAELGVPILCRLSGKAGASLRNTVEQLLPHVTGFVLTMTDAPAESAERLTELLASARGRQVWLQFTADVDLAAREAQIRNALTAGATGLWLTAARRTSDGLRETGRALLPAVLARLRHLRQTFGSGVPVVAGGAHSPADAMELQAAGATLVTLDSGLVFSGPGLAKRVNDAWLFQQTRDQTDPQPTVVPAARRSWFWCLMLGVSMFIGGLLALAIAWTRTVLPYDEVFCGMTREQLIALNPRLLPFMAHDRITLAGTMITAGLLYAGLAWQAVRRGAHWAKVTVITSATSGFFSFFLFLGFGYFDPFHAFVTAILFQFLLFAFYASLDPAEPPSLPELEDSPAWRRGQWGQLLFVALGIGIVGAGLTISTVGATSVLVPEDLEFMRTSEAVLKAANARLVPLIAHDRASLGGMLIACGLAVWLTAQWGFRAGERWLWWLLLVAGLPSFVGAIGIHFAVGYLNLKHLAPAGVGMLVFLIALVCSRAWLCDSAEVRRAKWERFIRPTGAGGSSASSDRPSAAKPPQ